MRSRHFALPALALALGAAALLAGCERPEQYPRWSQSRQERLRLFAGVEKLAVVPFRDKSGAQWPADLGPEQFTKLFADEAAKCARFKVLYPHQVVAAVEGANRSAVEQARLNKRELKDDEIIDLGRSEDDAVAAGRVLGADAVLVGAIDDFDPYPPKRLALTVRVYLCRAPGPDAREIILQSDAGVPLEITGALREKFIWERQKYYDARRKNTATGLDWDARKHTEVPAYGGERNYYVTENFLGYVAGDLVALLYDDAQWYKHNPPRAPRAGKAPGAGWPAGRPRGPGYDPEEGEHGTGR